MIISLAGMAFSNPQTHMPQIVVFALGFAGIQMKDSVGTLVRSLATCNVTLR